MTTSLESSMEDLRERLARIEEQGKVSHTAQRVMENSFEKHEAQNERDFKHVDGCIHRADDESRNRDEAIMRSVEKLSQDVASRAEKHDAEIQELKQFMWKVSGALLVLVPLSNQLLGKLL